MKKAFTLAVRSKSCNNKEILHIQRSRDIASDCADGQGFALKRVQDDKAAFTLAELLIVLGIIGIIAALTMPSLMANHRKQVVLNKLKKFYSVTTQAVIKTTEQEGSDSWITECDQLSCTSPDLKDWYNRTLGKNLNTLKVQTYTDNSGGILVYLNDGTLFQIPSYINEVIFYTDANAYKNPKFGVNMFYFYLGAVNNGWNWSYANGFETYGPGDGYGSWYGYDDYREALFHSKGFGCAEEPGWGCTRLIQYDGWRIADDYPHRF